MPLDDTGRLIDLDTPIWLEKLGIVPVSQEFVAKHKQNVLTDFISRSQSNADLVESGVAKWNTSLLCAKTYDINKRRWNRPPSVRQALKRPPVGGYANDRSAPPAALIDLAESVSKRLPEARFELDWFDVDPVLSVVYEGEAACLGIWNDGQIVAIAEHRLVLEHPKRWSFIGWLFRR